MKRRLLVYVVVGVALSGASVVVPELADFRPECEQAASWVLAHARSLPTDFRDLSALPRAYRVRIFDALPSEAKSKLWRSWLDRVLEEEQLTPRQREVVREASTFVTPALYSQKAIPAAQMADLARRVKEVFPKKQAGEIFSTLGPQEGSYRTLASAKVLVGQRVTRILAVSAADCNCTSGAFWTQCDGCSGTTFPSGYCCLTSQCTPTSSGCSLFWLYPCDGDCRYVACEHCGNSIPGMPGI